MQGMNKALPTALFYIIPLHAVLDHNTYTCKDVAHINSDLSFTAKTNYHYCIAGRHLQTTKYNNNYRITIIYNAKHGYYL